MTMEDQQRIAFDRLLDYLKHSRGFDFSGYKRASLMRRIVKRMEMIGIEDFGDYIDFLEVHPEEFSLLFNTILINVTGFYRDSKTWEYVNSEIIPKLLTTKASSGQIRIWSAGCASGEEAYTVTILMAEYLGIEGFRERVKVYATDLDEDALSKARLASYSENELQGLPPELIKKYFEQSGDRWIFSKELRRTVIFGRHDLIQDAPISKIDLLICRNILMYFNAETQSRILSRLNYALSENGYLFLGKAEMLLTHANLFTPIDLRNRIFIKANTTMNMRDRRLNLSENGNDNVNSPVSGFDRVRESAFDAGSVAQVVVDSKRQLVLINEKARNLFGISLRELGRPFKDLQITNRSGELQSSLEKTLVDESMTTMREIELKTGQVETLCFNALMVPLKQNDSSTIGVSISFVDVTEHKNLQKQLEQTNQELETAMEELQSTNEELETTNEELQSTIEELETTNEELQSTNEELETMNEELQSTNEELETINTELNQRTNELNQFNAFLSSILTSLRGGVIVVDNNLSVKIWNRKSEDMWGVRSEEAMGHHLYSLDFGLPIEQLKRPINSILNGDSDAVEVQLIALNRRGRTVQCDVACTPLVNVKKEVKGVIFIVEQTGVLAEAPEIPQ